MNIVIDSKDSVSLIDIDTNIGIYMKKSRVFDSTNNNIAISSRLDSLKINDFNISRRTESRRKY
jgi:hypothetical protein